MSTPDSFPYAAIRTRWCEVFNSDRKHDLMPAHFLLYMALMNRDWRKAFSPIRRPSKLANGHRPYASAEWALAVVRSPYKAADWIAFFDGLITQEVLDDLRARLPRSLNDAADALPDVPYVEVTNDAGA